MAMVLVALLLAVSTLTVSNAADPPAPVDANATANANVTTLGNGTRVLTIDFSDNSTADSGASGNATGPSKKRGLGIVGEGPKEGKLNVDLVPEDDFAGGDTTAYIGCVKRNGVARPQWDWMENKANVGIFFRDWLTVGGKWTNYKCAFGEVDAFHVSKKDYLKYASKCAALGYDTVQPANSIVNSWMPFQVGESLMEHIKFSMTGEQGGTFYPITPIPSCTQG
jgi:hypothetical protein